MKPEEVVNDPIAEAITAFTKDGASVVTFCGWVVKDGANLRIFDDGDFGEFFEIKIDDVKYQLVGASLSHENFRSVLWVDASATITRGQRASAAYFSSGGPMPGSDPAAGYVPPPKRP